MVFHGNSESFDGIQMSRSPVFIGWVGGGLVSQRNQVGWVSGISLASSVHVG